MLQSAIQNYMCLKEELAVAAGQTCTELWKTLSLHFLVVVVVVILKTGLIQNANISKGFHCCFLPLSIHFNLVVPYFQIEPSVLNLFCHSLLLPV